MLAATAGFRSGAGKVLLAVPEMLALHVSVAFPEAGVHGFTCSADGNPEPVAAAEQLRQLLPHVDAGVIGPGFTDEARAQRLAALLLETQHQVPLVMDAMALTGMWQRPDLTAAHPGRLVVTPHAGEMARLMGIPQQEVTDDPARAAVDAARHLQCIVALKGSRTVIAQPDGRAYLHEGGIAGLATSGSGDVLAGIIGGLMAQGADSLCATLWGVFLHAQAGVSLSRRMGGVGFLARELPDELPLLAARRR